MPATTKNAAYRRIQHLVAQTVAAEKEDEHVEKFEAKSGITVKGGCFCGKVTYEADLPSLSCGHCHCSMCRRMSMAAYVTWYSVPMDRLRIKGLENLKTFTSGTHTYRRFCDKCSSPLFCDDRQEHPDVTVVTFASLADTKKFDKVPLSHGFWTDRVEWGSVNADDGLPRHQTPKKYNPGNNTDFLVRED